MTFPYPSQSSCGATLRLALGSLVAGALFVGCDGSSSSRTGENTQIARPQLQSVEFGRLVDVYAYRRIDASNPDRRDSRNRRPVLIERNVVINTLVESEDLFNAIGGERVDADYRFLPFNVDVGHEELVILWDDTNPVERSRFDAALRAAESNLSPLPPSYRTQNTATRPIPVVPRNAALRLNFDTDLNVASSFFDANPNTVQLLEFIGDPTSTTPSQAFRPARYRVIPQGDSLILDTTLIGGEAAGRATSTGLAPSRDQSTANFRIALPTGGVASQLLNVSEDPIADLNGSDALGNPAVIRDFRSGNDADGRVGALSDNERPTIVGRFEMGIVDVDPVNNTVTINKARDRRDERSPARDIAIRGRIPFVDGALDPVTGVPGGRSTVPTVNAALNRSPLAGGDLVQQTVLSPAGESVRIVAEVIENLDVGVTRGDPNFPAPGLTPSGSDGGELALARLRLSTVSAFDSQGNEVTFAAAASGSPLGADCIVRTRYYESVPYANDFGISASVSDSDRRAEFLVIDPPPGQLASGSAAVRFASPMTAIGLRFSEPIDLANIDPTNNVFYANEEFSADIVSAAMDLPKSAGLSVLPSRIIDQQADGTVIKLSTPLGFFHEQGSEELYWLHAFVDQVQDLAGNAFDPFDRRQPGQTQVAVRSNGAAAMINVDVPIETFSVQFEMDAAAETNLVGVRTYRFEDTDEDGTVSGSIDIFGQFRIVDGRLLGAEPTRTSAIIDGDQLGTVERVQRGECVQRIPAGTMPPTPPMSVNVNPGIVYNFGLLYSWTGVPINTIAPPAIPTSFQPPGGAQNFGGAAEPHVRRGSRMQLTYREDDMGLDYHDANQLNLDVEQLHWAPWNDNPAYFDSFDRYALYLGHANKRPDYLFYLDAEDACQLDCASLFSGLEVRFADNVLQGSSMKRVVRPARYTVSPARAFRNGPANVKFVPYPTFDETYTWRDSRLVSWDTARDVPVGLGGAQDAETPVPGGDRTASVSSPWAPDRIDLSVDGPITPDWQFTDFVRDTGDFLGDRTRDHDPIALPLLVEFRISPDDSVSSATSGNVFWFGHVGAQFAGRGMDNGYYNRGGGVSTTIVAGDMDHVQCNGVDWPRFRVHATGGVDLLTGADNLVFPDDQQADVAVGGVLRDMGAGRLPHDGLFQSKPGDAHVYWGQVDFIRRVSLATFGFFDTLQPNRHALGTSLPGLPVAEGRPNMAFGTDIGADEFMVLLDPPVQGGGASIDVEIRGVRQIGEMGSVPGLYDPLADDTPENRGNLLNPNYACEAYRYSQPFSEQLPRVTATGFTPYVDGRSETAIDSIRDSRTGLLPRFMNMRLSLNAAIDEDPVEVPALRSASIVYRARR